MDDFELFLNEGPSGPAAFGAPAFPTHEASSRAAPSKAERGAAPRHRADREGSGYQGFSSGMPIDADVGALTLAERHLVGALLADNERYAIVSHLRPDDFSDVVCSRIYRVIQDVLEEDIPGVSAVDVVTCAAYPEVGRIITPARLRGMVDQVGALSDETLLAHAELVRRRGGRRRLARKLIEVQTLVENDVSTESQIERAIRLVSDTADDSMSQNSVKSMGHFSTLALDEMTRSIEAGEPTVGIQTGLAKLDEKICGLVGGQMIVVAGRPAMGKTALAFGFIRHAAEQGKYVQVFSLEMGGIELSKRMISMASGVPGERIRRGTLTSEDFKALAEANERIKTLPIMLDDEPRQDMAKIRASARRAARMGQLDMIVIDYLQLIASPPGMAAKRQEAITDISREMKLLAKELNVPLVVLSQLNRNLEQRPDKRPVMSDLRESGAIEQDADVILFIYRDEVYNPNTLDTGIAEIIVGKQRAGSVGTVRVRFDNETTRFADLKEAA